MPKLKSYNLSYFFSQIFFILFLFYSITIFFEIIFQGTITRYSNINWLLLAVIIFANLAIIFKLTQKYKSILNTKIGKDIFLLLMFIIIAAGTVLIYYSLENFGNLVACIISVISLLLVVFLAAFMYNESVNKN